MVLNGAENAVRDMIGNMEDVSCLICNGRQMIVATEAGSYQDSWVNHYLETLIVWSCWDVLFHLLLCWNVQDTKRHQNLTEVKKAIS